MHSISIKEKIKELRVKGTSINDLSNGFNVSKSTVSSWCKDIILSPEAINKILHKGENKKMEGMLRYSEAKRSERIKRTLDQKKIGSEMIGSLTDRDVLLFGLGLYWGEGYKYENCELGFTNSNPSVILFYIRWMEIFGIKKDDMIFRLTINDFFKNFESDIKKFWLEVLGVNESQFSKTTIIKTRLIKASLGNMKNYKGIMRVKIRKGAALRNRIIGAIEHVSNSI